jgi:hypothetical protein
MTKVILFTYLVITIFSLTDASLHLRGLNSIDSTGGNGNPTGGNDDFLEIYDNNV